METLTLDVEAFFEKVSPYLADQIEDLASDAQHNMGFDFNLDVYKQLHGLGMWEGVVVEEDGEVVGYASITYNPHLHNTSTIVCQVDFIGSNKEKRGRGVGAILIKTVEELAKGRGCAIVIYGLKDHKSGVLKNKLLESQYSYAETKYYKEI